MNKFKVDRKRVAFGKVRLEPVDSYALDESHALDEFHYAGFWIRLVAFLIDIILSQLVAFIVASVVGIAIVAGFLLGGEKPGPAFLEAVVDIIGTAVEILYFCVPTASGWQASPGKRIVGIHVVRTAGHKVSFGLAIGRYLAYLPSTLILGIGFFMIIWNQEKEALQDKICGTRVVYDNA